MKLLYRLCYEEFNSLIDEAKLADLAYNEIMGGGEVGIEPALKAGVINYLLERRSDAMRLKPRPNTGTGYLGPGHERPTGVPPGPPPRTLVDEFKKLPPG